MLKQRLQFKFRLSPHHLLDLLRIKKNSMYFLKRCILFKSPNTASCFCSELGMSFKYFIVSSFRTCICRPFPTLFIIVRVFLESTSLISPCAGSAAVMMPIQQAYRLEQKMIAKFVQVGTPRIDSAKECLKGASRRVRPLPLTSLLDQRLTSSVF
jgi:hypothetical protein